MSDQMVEITIEVPAKDIHIDVNRIDYDKGDSWNPECIEVDVAGIEIDGLKYDIIEWDDSVIDLIAFERAQ